MFILQWDRPVDRLALDVTHPVARVELISASIEVLGDQAELDDQHAREVECGRLTAFLTPEPQQGLLIPTAGPLV